MNWQVLLFGTLASLVAAASCCVVPAWAALRMNLEAALREGNSRVSGSTRTKRFQDLFMIGQSAASVVLLIASCLVVLSERAMLRTDTGFAHLDTLTMNLALRGTGTEGRRHFYSELLRRLKDSPSISSAGGVLVRPFEGSIGWDMTYECDFEASREHEQLPDSNFEVITPGYLATVGTPLLEGRDITDHDSESSQKVVIISAGLAAKMRNSGHEPIGTRIRFGRHHDGAWWTVIGVAGNTRYRGITTRDEDIYVSYLQSGIPVNYLAVRGRGEPRRLLALVREQVAALDPTRAVASVATLGELRKEDSARQRFNMLLLLSFGLAAIGLTSAGIYSVVSEAMSERRREIAIRIALGSDRPTLVRRYLWRTLLRVFTGESVGLLLALGLGNYFSSVLYGVRFNDVTVLLSAVGLVSACASVAASIPAWTASGVPLRSLLD